jgi:uncharacterized membrane protein
MTKPPTDAKPAKRPPRILRFMRARRRLSMSVAVGVVAFIAMSIVPPSSAWMVATRLLVAWDVTVALFLILAYAMMWRTDMSHVKRNAVLQDEGRFSILIVTGSAAFASLAAIVAELSGAQHDPVVLIFATATIVLSWATVHTIFALHYAHEYYYAGAAGGMNFPEDDKPDYWDFVYFSFVIGMTAQVSDVAITDKVVRRTATAHGIISFGFNTALLALMINIAASAL